MPKTQCLACNTRFDKASATAGSSCPVCRGTLTHHLLTEHIAIWQVSKIPYVAERIEYNIHPNYDGSHDYTYFEGDPDYVKWHGEEGRGECPFFVITDDTEEHRWVIYEDEPDDEIIEIVDWWLAGSKDDHFKSSWAVQGEDDKLEANWENWDKVEKGIAYRGGAGYVYSLFGMTLKQEESNG
jgi:hypothetical protein